MIMNESSDLVEDDDDLNILQTQGNVKRQINPILKSSSRIDLRFVGL